MRWLKLKDVIERTTLSKSSIHRLLDAGDFPKPLKMKGINLWVEEEIDRWMTAQVAALRT